MKGVTVVFQRHSRFGVTLVEVLVSIGILAVLMALAAPAIQQARAVSARLRCINNLKQLALASHSFHDSHSHLPGQGLVRWTSSPQDAPGVISSWGLLLGYLGESNLAEKIDYRETAAAAYPVPGSPYNAELLKISLSVLQCPADSSRVGSTNYRTCQGIHPYSGANEAVNRGAYFSSGMVGRPAKFSLITDGLSNTALCSEKIVGDFDDAQYSPVRDVIDTNGPNLPNADAYRNLCDQLSVQPVTTHASSGGGTWLLNSNLYTWYNHVLTPNSRIPDCSTGGDLTTGAITVRSWHEGGASVALADGAVRFVSQEIDLLVWRSMGSRSGNEAQQYPSD
ncbi:MAG: DUF1559 domain-containing protein [Planctomycetaceae bacterium]|nr:DUF1559 domain-containing protein [Planctomycetaceae bacterium]